MSDTDQSANLRVVAAAWWTPDPKIVSKLPKGGNKDKSVWRNCSVCGGWHAPNAIHVDYVGHADLTRTLIEIDPLWSWEPFALDSDGLPLVVQRGNQAVMWGRVTILGKTLPCVGTCDLGKSDADKELVGDLLRNAAMRFGIYGALWSKTDGWESVEGEGDHTSAPSPVSAVDAGGASAEAPSRPELIPPDKPLDEMSVRELISYAREIGVSVSGTKSDMLHVLRPYAGAATGEEPFGLDGPKPEPRDDPHDAEFNPVVANPAVAVRDSLKGLPGTERTAVRSSERTP